jgi:hypothetical protein
MNTQEAAIYYLRRGWRVVPIPRQRKGPVLKGWNKLALTSEDVPSMFSISSNIGILLGEPSGWLVDVDLDCDEARELASQYLPATEAKTGRESSPGSHWWYVASGAETHAYNDPIDKRRTVELRSTGGQTVVGPSLHPSGETYDLLAGDPATIDAAELAECVDSLHQAILAARHGTIDPSPMIVERANGTDLHARAIAYLDRIPPAISGQRGHATLLWAATCLINGFCLSADDALDVLTTRYNPRCEPPWSDRELRHKVDEAIKKPPTRFVRGWLRDSQSINSNDDIDISNLINGADFVSPFPEHLLEVPGLIGDVIRHNLATAHRRQPVLALAGAIALQAVLAGRKVRDTRGNRTNVYLIGLAISGGGKDHARKINRQILAQAGLDRLEGPEEAASESGLNAIVCDRKVVLLQYDEFGRFLKTLGEEKNSHLYGIPSTLLKLFSCAGTMYQPKAYADAKKNPQVDQPCVVLYATTVPESFWGGLTIDSLSDGFLARLLVFEGDGLPPETEAEEQRIPEPIIDAARQWGAFGTGGNLADEHPEPKVVKSTDEAKAIVREFGEKIDAQYDRPDRKKYWAILARAREQALRLALIYACSESIDPTIDVPAARWACELVEYLTNRLISRAEQRIEGSQFGRDQQRVLTTLREAGGVLTRTQLVRAHRGLRRRELQEVLDRLEECRWIKITTVTTNGRPSQRISQV